MSNTQYLKFSTEDDYPIYIEMETTFPPPKTIQDITQVSNEVQQTRDIIDSYHIPEIEDGVQPATIIPDRVKEIFTGTQDKLKEISDVKFEDALQVVKRNATSFIKTIRGMSDEPDEVEVTFGLKANGDFGNLAIAKVAMEANYTVKLVWKKPDK